MSSSGYAWSAFAFAEVAAADVDATAVADEATLTTDEISLDNIAACEVAITAVEDNTGACDGNVYFYVLGQGATGWETISDDPAQAAALDVDQNTTRHAVFSVDPGEYGGFKVLVDNDCGQEVAVSIKVRTATFDTA